MGERLLLLDGFELCCDERPVALPMTAQRLLAFLALRDRPVSRSQVAGCLWVDTTDEHATASLRSALWRLRRPGLELVEASLTHLRLAGGVSVDYREAADWAQALLDQPEGPGSGLGEGEGGDGGLTRELLPDWQEDWVVVERERFRQLRLHALEVRCRRLAGAGRFAQAVQAGLAAVACEPLRDSAHRLLIWVHLVEGNRAEAIRQYRLYCRLLHDELGLAPSPQVQQLLHGLAPARVEPPRPMAAAVRQ
jgi:DNA-binding SARP family transcriptional activator